jgi:hypothetical protein
MFEALGNKSQLAKLGADTRRSPSSNAQTCALSLRRTSNGAADPPTRRATRDPSRTGWVSRLESKGWADIRARHAKERSLGKSCAFAQARGRRHDEPDRHGRYGRRRSPADPSTVRVPKSEGEGCAGPLSSPRLDAAVTTSRTAPDASVAAAARPQRGRYVW